MERSCSSCHFRSIRAILIDITGCGIISTFCVCLQQFIIEGNAGIVQLVGGGNKLPFAVPTFSCSICMSDDTCQSLSIGCSISPAKRRLIAVCIMNVVVAISKFCNTVGVSSVVHVHGVTGDSVTGGEHTLRTSTDKFPIITVGGKCKIDTGVGQDSGGTPTEPGLSHIQERTSTYVLNFVLSTRHRVFACNRRSNPRLSVHAQTDHCRHSGKKKFNFLHNKLIV